MNNPNLIKYLSAQGLTGKQIRVVTQSKQPYISKVLTGRITRDAEAAADFDAADKARYDTLNKILALPSLKTDGTTDMDRRYIALLVRLMVNKRKIATIYPKYPDSTMARIGADKSIDLHQFDSTLIGIDKVTYEDLISVL
jgi:hypothetical protein